MHAIKHWASVLGLLAGLTLLPAQAAQIKVCLTVDNSCALLVGNATGATSSVGSDDGWPTVETYNFDLDDNACLYVMTASGRNVAQGFLGQFENLSRNYKFYSHDPQWQLMATGLGRAAP